MKILWNSELYHYGVPRRSGRYKWGSGKNPYHHGVSSPRALKKAYKSERKTIWKQSDQYLKENRKDYKEGKKVDKLYAKNVKQEQSKPEAKLNIGLAKKDRKERYKEGQDDIYKNTGIAQFEAKKAYRKALAARIKDVKGSDSAKYKKSEKLLNRHSEKITRIRMKRILASGFTPMGMMPKIAESYRVSKHKNKYNVGYERYGKIKALPIPTKDRFYAGYKLKKDSNGVWR